MPIPPEKDKTIVPTNFADIIEQQRPTIKVGMDALAETLEPRPDFTEHHPLDRYIDVMRHGYAECTRSGRPIMLTKKKAFGWLVKACMTAQWRGMTLVDVDGWFKDDFETMNIITAKRPGSLAKPRKFMKTLRKAWATAERNIASDKGLTPDEHLGRLREALGRKKKLLELLDDMISQMRHYGQRRFVYPTREAASRLGWDFTTVSRQLKKLRSLGICSYVRGSSYDPEMSSGKSARASIYWFNADDLGEPEKLQHKITPTPAVPSSAKRAPSRLAILRQLNGSFGKPLSFADVVAQGYGVKEWRSWLRHLTNKRDKLRQQHLDDYLRDDRWPTEVSQVESDLVAAEWDRGGRAANDEYELQRRKRTLSWLAGRANGYSAARRVLTVNT